MTYYIFTSYNKGDVTAALVTYDSESDSAHVAQKMEDGSTNEGEVDNIKDVYALMRRINGTNPWAYLPHIPN